jgi:hypothetical protein
MAIEPTPSESRLIRNQWMFWAGLATASALLYGPGLWYLIAGYSAVAVVTYFVTGRGKVGDKAR